MTYQAKNPSAFINQINDEGSKAEAVEWLQRIYDELCACREHLRVEQVRNDQFKRMLDPIWDYVDSLPADQVPWGAQKTLWLVNDHKRLREEAFEPPKDDTT